MTKKASVLMGPFTTPAAVGADGSATSAVTSTSAISGLVVGVYVQYAGDKPGTTDFTLTTLGTAPSAPATTILSLANNVTDGWYYPRVNAHNTSGAAQATQWEYLPIADKVVGTVAQTNTDDTVKFWLMVLQ